MGIWVDGQFSWLGSTEWQQRLRYGHNSLVTDVLLENTNLGIRLLTRDAVDFHENLLMRQITVENRTDKERECRIFFCHDLSISGTTVGDSAYYEPEWQTLFHYKGRCWFMIGIIRGWKDKWRFGLDQWAVGLKEIQDHEGSWRDAEDGELSGNPVAQGSIDSVAALHLSVPPLGQATGWYTLIVGADYKEVTRIYISVIKKGPDVFVQRTDAYWRLWVEKDGTDFIWLPKYINRLYKRSLLILRSQIDNQGAIIAANDFDIALFNRDTYSYMWPRDAALVAAALVQAGYSEISRRFFDFCHKVITDEGFLLHKYTPDGSLASSWHGWYLDGMKSLPVQEDETALMLWALWRHFDRFRDIEFLKRHYRGMIIRGAEWMCSFFDKENDLPLPSWDLWEERHGVHSWTVAAVWAGLHAAANFAESFGEQEQAVRYRRRAKRIKEASRKLLWNAESGSFVRMLGREKGELRQDTTMDASIIGLWYFGMFSAKDPQIVSTMKVLEKRLWVQTEVGGMARYENDYYHQVTNDIKKVPGNPWFICTLWLAQWYIAIAENLKELNKAQKLIEWVASHSLESGVMAEQVHPFNNSPLSVSPLTWSHATYVSTILEFNDKLKLLENNE